MSRQPRRSFRILFPLYKIDYNVQDVGVSERVMHIVHDGNFHIDGIDDNAYSETCELD